MNLDWALASLHHLAAFALCAILAAELALTADLVDAATAKRLARIDAWYGIVAALVLAAGLARVFLAAKGAAYYAFNSLFWAKMAVFALVATLSVAPTLQFLRWRRAAMRVSARRRSRLGECAGRSPRRRRCSRCCRSWRPHRPCPY